MSGKPSAASIKLMETMIRLGKGMVRALEEWLEEAKK